MLMELLRRAGEYRHYVGAVMYRYDMLDAQEPDGVGGLERTHDEPVADGQQSEVGSIDLTYKLHVSEEGGITCVVEPEAALELQNVSHRFSAVDEASVLRLDARGVECVGCGDLNPAKLGGAPLLDRLCVLDALALQVGHDLEVRQDRRPGLLGYGYRIIEVIEVAVGDEHSIELTDLLHVLRGSRVVGQERVYDDLLVPRGYEPEGRVPHVGDPGPSKHILHINLRLLV